MSRADNPTTQTFVLSSTEWYDLQTRLQSVLALPYNYGEYEGRYGGASSGLQMKECFDAMNKLQGVAIRCYGNPKQLRANILKNPNYLTSAERPDDDAYGATIWTIDRAHHEAASLASVLKAIPATARNTPAPEVVNGIKQLFLDPGQIADRMQKTVKELDALLKQFQASSDELAAAQDAMRVYTRNSSTTQNALNKEIGALEAKIAQLESDRDVAYRKWLDLTISACVVPAVIGVVGIALMVVLSVPTSGASFAVGTAVTTAAAGAAAAGLGIAASNARASYDDLVKQVSSQNDFMRKRIAYRHDLGALDGAMAFTLPASDKVFGQVSVVRDAWARSLDEITGRVRDLDVNNLADSLWLQEKAMTAAAAGWHEVDQAMVAFLGNSLVDTSLLTFGSSLPKDDPNWSDNFGQKRAA